MSAFEFHQATIIAFYDTHITHVKGVEYIMSLLAIARFLLYLGGPEAQAVSDRRQHRQAGSSLYTANRLQGSY